MNPFVLIIFSITIIGGITYFFEADPYKNKKVVVAKTYTVPTPKKKIVKPKSNASWKEATIIRNPASIISRLGRRQEASLIQPHVQPLPQNRRPQQREQSHEHYFGWSNIPSHKNTYTARAYGGELIRWSKSACLIFSTTQKGLAVAITSKEDSQNFSLRLWSKHQPNGQPVPLLINYYFEPLSRCREGKSVRRVATSYTAQRFGRKKFNVSAVLTEHSRKVRGYQRSLIRAGYDRVRITGKYDRETKRAVSHWKRINNLRNPRDPTLRRVDWWRLKNYNN